MSYRDFVSKTYREGNPVDVRDNSLRYCNPTDELRQDMNERLRKFLDSEAQHAEITFTTEDVDGQTYERFFCLSKAIFNVKTCANIWAQYEMVVFPEWPDVICKVIGSKATHDYVEGEVVMPNEVLSSNYSAMNSYTPKGYFINPLDYIEVECKLVEAPNE